MTIIKITSSERDGYHVLTLSGQIDETNLATLEEAVSPLLGRETHLAFDLAELDFINSKVIGYLAATHGKLDESDQKMIFVQPNDSIFDILELVGLTQIVPVFETEEELQKALAAGEI